jgi:thiamine biosynthesis lipoprotein ApbE
MDPRSGRPVQGVLSVAVLAGSGMEGDALDNAFYVEGVDASRTHLERLPGVDAVFFLPRGARWTTVRLENPRRRVDGAAGSGPRP